MSISLSYESNFDEGSSNLGSTKKNSNEWRVAAEAVLIIDSSISTDCFRTFIDELDREVSHGLRTYQS